MSNSFLKIKKIMTRWKEIILITLSIRILLLILGVVANTGKNLNPLYYWVQWDGPHYIDLAKNWYQNSGGEQPLWIVFYPLYPILIRILNTLVNDYLTSTILISIFFSFTAAILLYELVLLDFNKRTAFLSVWFLNIFPTAYYLQASYTESLFLTISLATIFFFRKGSLINSTVTGILSSMTRVNGILLAPLLLFEIKKPRKIVPILLLPLGFIFYLYINYVTFSEPFYFTKPLLSNWYKKLEFPWVGISNLIHSLPPLTNPSAYPFYAEVVTLILILIVGIYTIWKIRFSYGIYVLLNLLLITSTSFVISTPRYAIILFPIYIALSKIKSVLLIAAVSIISLSLMLYFASIYVQGQWTF